MKLVISYTPENVRSHNRSTHGVEFLETVKNHEGFFDLIQGLEDVDFFPEENGFVFNAQGGEVYDPEYPNIFDFGDYDYRLIEVNQLDSHKDADLIRAIEQANPWNLSEIKELIIN